VEAGFGLIIALTISPRPERSSSLQQARGYKHNQAPKQVFGVVTLHAVCEE
jgi:hypothetical protein